MVEFENEEDQHQWEQEHDLKYVWKCSNPGCDYEYEEEPGVNEGLQCPECNVPTVKYGESYLG